MADRWPGLRDGKVRRMLVLALAGIAAGMISVSFFIARGLRTAGVEVAEWQVLLALLAIAGTSVLQETVNRPPPPRPRKERIRELTAALEQATELVDELRAEIAEGEQLAERYKADIARYEQLAALRRQEVEAVALELRSELRSGERRGIVLALLTNALVGAAFFALGLWVQV